MDDELDRHWKPSGRPQSTIARNFSVDLDNLFKIDGDLDTLDRTVHQKKQAVSTHTQELQALEAKLRETEERLKQANTSQPAFSRKNSQRRTPIHGTFTEAEKARTSEPNSPLSQVTTAPPRRPAQLEPQTTSEQPSLAPTSGAFPGPMPGAMPGTPRSYTSREYVMVDRPDEGQANGDGEGVRPQP